MVLDTSTSLSLERTFLAYESTLLGWIRTSTSLISFGFSIQQFFRVARAGQPPSDRLIGPQEFGLLMRIVALVVLAMATWQHRLETRALEARYPGSVSFPGLRRSNARIVAALIAVLGALGVLSMVLRN